MKTIGFADYFLDEWHANNYPAWIKELSEKAGKDFEFKYAWAEIDHPAGGRTTDAWCKDFGVERCNTLEELCEKSDYIIVLAPSNPEKHLGYAETVLKYKKNTYIDKTFAPDYATAKAIFDLAEKYGTKFFSSSALRYSDELTAYAGKAKAISTLGGGGNFDEYIIHQTEMVVKTLGVGAEKVRYVKCADQERVEVVYADGRVANMFFAPCLPFAATVADENGVSAHLPVQSAFFNNLIADMLRFFEEGTTSFSSEETLEVMKIREAAIKAKASAGEWLAL